MRTWLPHRGTFKALLIWTFASFLINAKALAQAGTNEMKWRWETYLSSTYLEKSKSEANPNNLVFSVPTYENILDTRLDLTWFINDAKVIARPRWTATQKTIEQNSLITNEETSKSSTLGKIDLTDFFWEQTWSRRWKSTMGLQVYQWGPSEIYNSTNPFFDFQKEQQTFLFKEKGKNLLRFNFSPNQENSWIFIAEPVSNNEHYPFFDRAFKPQWIFKFEKSKRRTRNYWGLLAGQEHQGNTMLGQYGQFEFKPGHSIFMDIKESQSYSFYRPEQKASGAVDFSLDGENSGRWSTLGSIGYRYEGDIDLRLEYLYNSLGYKSSDWSLVRESLTQFTNPEYVNNLMKFKESGLKIYSEKYLYFSIRVSNPFKTEDLNAFLRTFYSLSDSSGLAETEFDTAMGDYFTLFASYSYNYGKENSEFLLQNKWRFQIGLKYLL